MKVTIRSRLALLSLFSVIFAFCGPAATADFPAYAIEGTSQAAQPTEVPNQATIFLRSGTRYHLRCGGAIISNRYILTSAQCAYRTNVADLQVIVGVTQTKDFQTAPKHHVQAIKIHPGFTPDPSRGIRNDIALLRLPAALRFSNQVQPVALDGTSNSWVGHEARISGFGRTDPNNPNVYSTNLRVARVRVVSTDTCQRAAGSNIPLNPNTQSCIESPTSAVALGDFGGPVEFIHNNRLLDIGVTSFGFGNYLGYPTVVTRIGAYQAWIRANAS
ncbi:serine protease [Streptomyces noursei]|uniref:S1 family serine peptidase n=1 Tax=Streptomyces noursei TaxID=1971 RepID=UPI00081CB32C|nr:Trypsin [Streptomyces noursei ATCC 11455]MCZ0993820.1 serine protease [Streptomyces noursei]